MLHTAAAFSTYGRSPAAVPAERGARWRERFVPHTVSQAITGGSGVMAMASKMSAAATDGSGSSPALGGRERDAPRERHPALGLRHRSSWHDQPFAGP